MRYPVLFLLFASLVATSAHAASWEKCKSRKLEAIRLEKALRRGSKVKGYRSREAMRRERRHLDDWLWRNCRYYDSELRDLYGKYM